jgi:hypothetical protein
MSASKTSFSNSVRSNYRHCIRLSTSTNVIELLLFVTCAVRKLCIYCFQCANEQCVCLVRLCSCFFNAGAGVFKPNSWVQCVTLELQFLKWSKVISLISLLLFICIPLQFFYGSFRRQRNTAEGTELHPDKTKDWERAPGKTKRRLRKPERKKSSRQLGHWLPGLSATLSTSTTLQPVPLPRRLLSQSPTILTQQP